MAHGSGVDLLAVSQLSHRRRAVGGAGLSPPEDPILDVIIRIRANCLSPLGTDDWEPFLTREVWSTLRQLFPRQESPASSRLGTGSKEEGRTRPEL